MLASLQQRLSQPGTESSGRGRQWFRQKTHPALDGEATVADYRQRAEASDLFREVERARQLTESAPLEIQCHV